MVGTTRAALSLFVVQTVCQVSAFQPLRPAGAAVRSPCVNTVHHQPLLWAKRKNGRVTGKSKGFGNVEESTVSAAPAASPAAEPMAQGFGSEPAAAGEPTLPKGAFLQSVEGGTDATPTMQESAVPPEERTKQLLREKYGMKTLEEQQASEKQMQQVKAQQKRLAELKKKADEGEDVDLIAMIPAPILRGLDLFLKTGVAVSGLAFILAGLAITAEAYSKATGEPLPEDIDSFIVTVIEPNFTPGLLVVLGFSVSLGLLATAQLGSEGAQYKED